jgi:hypothetical protein
MQRTQQPRLSVGGRLARRPAGAGFSFNSHDIAFSAYAGSTYKNL